MPVRCRHCRKLIPLYIDGELDSVKCAQVEYHVRHCKACAQELKWQQWICEVLRSFPVVSPPADFTARTIERLRALHTHPEFHEPFTFVRAPWWKTLGYGFRMAGAMAALVVGVMIWSWLRTTPVAVNSVADTATNVTMTSNAHSKQLPVKSVKVAKAPTEQHTVLRSMAERLDTRSPRKKPISAVKTKRHGTPPTTASIGALAKDDAKGVIAPANAGESADAVMLAYANATTPLVNRGVKNSTLVNAQLALNTDAFIPVSYTPPRTALPKDTYTTDLQPDGNPKIASAREQLLIGKPWKAIQTLTGVLDGTAVSKWERYQVLRLLKYAHEKMGEWVLASALKEQLLNEVAQEDDANTALRLAQVCESDGDTTLAREL
ncbi:MAG TPA: zf-HC2 domain-containing protein, partial [Armatimonadetes bacterium]|nr:zf-HC2 domain-containing protein [Armatimonadota bacterium]